MNSIKQATAILIFALVTPAVVAGSYGRAQIQPFPTADNIPDNNATSYLQRSRYGLKIDVETNGLDPSSPYTIWAVIFNKPQYCHTSPCNEPDLPVVPGHDPHVRASIVYAGGGVTDADGHGRFIGRVATWDRHAVNTERLFGPGLLSAKKAEVHIIVRGHGYPSPEHVFSSIATFNGGCDDKNGHAQGCEDQQFAIHLAN